jgi:hypothetical protein
LCRGGYTPALKKIINQTLARRVDGEAGNIGGGAAFTVWLPLVH